MEMQRVPDAGYDIIGLPVRGLVRPLYSLKNIGVAIDFFRSKNKVKRVIREFRPQAAVGVGGYASAPTINAAYSFGVPCLIQEQNSYAGITNRSFAGKASRICVAYEGMERFFPADKIILTGNPVRQELLDEKPPKEEARKRFGFPGDKPAVLVVGGSLGARTLNESVMAGMDMIAASGVNFIWQTGSYYFRAIQTGIEGKKPGNVYVTEFIPDMGAAYAAADLVISRAGAGSISELCLLSKPSILVPSPNVAEDHQTHNAMELVKRGAALTMKDNEAKDRLIPLALEIVASQERLGVLGENAGRMAFRDSAAKIAGEVLKLAKS